MHPFVCVCVCAFVCSYIFFIAFYQVTFAFFHYEIDSLSCKNFAMLQR